MARRNVSLNMTVHIRRSVGTPFVDAGVAVPWGDLRIDNAKLTDVSASPQAVFGSGANITLARTGRWTFGILGFVQKLIPDFPDWQYGAGVSAKLDL